MCLLVKVAASRPLPTAPIDPEHRHIAVLDLNDWQGGDHYTRWMTLPYIYEVTSRYGCGCNLRFWPEDSWALMSDEATEEEEETRPREGRRSAACCGRGGDRAGGRPSRVVRRRG